jgi:DNA-binding transcriptional LysR family regulator
MDLKRMLYFCTIVEQGSVSKAAKVLNIAQPPLGKRLQELEEEIGAPLFLRTGRKMILTEAGIFLYKQSCQILSHVNEVKNQTLKIALQNKKIVNIGISYLFLSYFRPFLMALYEKHEILDINIIVSDSSHLENLLMEKAVDVALIQRPKAEQCFHITELANLKLVAVIPKGLTPEVSDNSITLAELAKLPLVLLHRVKGEGTFEFILNKLYSNIQNVNVLMKISEPRLIMEMLHNGLHAATLLPASEINLETESDLQVYDLVPEMTVFQPSFVSLTTAPKIIEIETIVQNCLL